MSSPLLSCYSVFLVLWQGLSTCFYFYFLWFSLSCSLEQSTSLFGGLFFFCLWSQGLVILLGLDNQFVSRNPTKIHASHSLEWILFFCRYHWVVWSNFNFLPNSQWITWPTVMSGFIQLLQYFTSFTYYMINGFVFIIT